MSRRILLTGGGGQVGQALRALAWPGDVTLLAPTRAELDLGDQDSIRRWIGQAGKLAGILNSGAYTAVDRAESDIAAAWAVNARAPALLAQAARQADIPLVQVSTDYVFDGAKPAPYVESDPIGPVGVYGASKAAAELAVAAAGIRHAIVRTSWVVSATESNFVKTMLRLGAERPSLGVVADQHGAPTAAGDLAEALRLVMLRHLEDRSAPGGVFHFANAGETTWHGVAAHVFAAAAAFGRRAPELRPIATADYPTPARRPANSRLDASRFSAAYGLAPRPWREAVDGIVAALLQEQTT